MPCENKRERKKTKTIIKAVTLMFVLNDAKKSEENYDYSSSVNVKKHALKQLTLAVGNDAKITFTVS